MSLQQDTFNSNQGVEKQVLSLPLAAPVKQALNAPSNGRPTQRESCTNPTSNNESVQVAVRVRPPLRNETTQDLVVTMDPSQQIVILQGTGPEGTAFCVDKPVWSGVGNALDRSAPVSQAVLYEQIGQPLLYHALDGFNSTLIAYGQTGSGKTYTMMGEIDPGTNDDEDALLESDEGITPRFCRELFQQIQQRSFTAPCGGEISWEVHLRYVEVYCERICDLLKNGAAVTLREEVVDDEMRFVIVGARRMRVGTTAEILRALRLGNRYRKTVATAQNERSSRSHAVVIIELTEVFSFIGPDGNVTSTPSKTVTVRLVDLAGSERLSDSGVTGKQFKEGVDINLSLFTLGMVIESLADPRRRGIRPPYRESILTKLLKDAFGGNSKTRMICTISPTAAQRSQTLQTLQYATKARCVMNKPRVDEDPIAAELRRANAELLQLRHALSEAKRGIRRRAHVEEQLKNVSMTLRQEQDESRLRALSLERVKAEMNDMREAFETMRMQYAERIKLHDERAQALLAGMEQRFRKQLFGARASELRLLRVLCLHGGAASDAGATVSLSSSFSPLSSATLSAAAVAAAAVRRLRDDSAAAHLCAYLYELEAEDAQREARHRAAEEEIAQSYRALLVRGEKIESDAIAAEEANARAQLAWLYAAQEDALRLAEKAKNEERAENIRSAENTANAKSARYLKDEESPWSAEDAERAESLGYSESAENIKNSKKAMNSENIESAESSENSENGKNLEETMSSENSESAESSEKAKSARNAKNAESAESSENSANGKNSEETMNSENSESAESSEKAKSARNAKNAESAESSENSANGKNSEETMNSENSESAESSEKAKSARNAKNAESAESSENSANGKNSEETMNSENSESAESSEKAKSAKNAKNAESAESSENSENGKNSEKAMNSENSESAESSEKAKSAKNAKNAESAESSQNSENGKNSEKAMNSENSESAESSEKAKSAMNLENIESAESSENSANGKNSEETMNSENSESAESSEKAKSAKNAKNAESAESSENSANGKNSEKAMGSENSESAESLAKAKSARNAKNAESAESSENSANEKNSEKAMGSENIESAESLAKAKSARNAKNAESAESSENSENGKNSEKAMGSENIESAESLAKAKSARNAKNAESAESSENSANGKKSEKATGSENSESAENAESSGNSEISEGSESAGSLQQRLRQLALEAEARVQVLRAREADVVRRRTEAAATAAEHERMLSALEADLAELLASNRATEEEIARRDAEIARERRCYADLRRLLEDREYRLRCEHAHRMDGKDSAVQLTDDLLDVNELLKRQLAMWIQKYKVLKVDQKIECEQCSYHNRRDAKVCLCCDNAQLV